MSTLLYRAVDPVGAWRGRGGERLDLLVGEVVDPQATLLGGDDHDRLRAVARVDPDGRVVARGVAALVVVVEHQGSRCRW
jgi:hypothetical protein